MGKITKIDFKDLQIIATECDKIPNLHSLKIKHKPTGREVDYNRLTAFQDIGFEKAILVIVKEVEGYAYGDD